MKFRRERLSSECGGPEVVNLDIRAREASIERGDDFEGQIRARLERGDVLIGRTEVVGECSHGRREYRSRMNDRQSDGLKPEEPLDGRNSLRLGSASQR